MPPARAAELLTSCHHMKLTKVNCGQRSPGSCVHSWSSMGSMAGKKKIGCNRGQKQPSWSKIAADSYRSVTSCIVRQWHQTRKKTNQINLKLYLLVPPPESFASRCHIFSLCEAGLNIPPSEGRMTSCNTIPWSNQAPWGCLADHQQNYFHHHHHHHHHPSWIYLWLAAHAQPLNHCWGSWQGVLFPTGSICYITQKKEPLWVSRWLAVSMRGVLFQSSFISFHHFPPARFESVPLRPVLTKGFSACFGGRSSCGECGPHVVCTPLHTNGIENHTCMSASMAQALMAEIHCFLQWQWTQLLNWWLTCAVCFWSRPKSNQRLSQDLLSSKNANWSQAPNPPSLRPPARIVWLRVTCHHLSSPVITCHHWPSSSQHKGFMSVFTTFSLFVVKVTCLPNHMVTCLLKSPVSTSDVEFHARWAWEMLPSVNCWVPNENCILNRTAVTEDRKTSHLR